VSERMREGVRERLREEARKEEFVRFKEK